MADVTPSLIEGRSTIVSYGGGGFRLSEGGESEEGRRVEGPIVLTPAGERNWPTAALTANGLASLFDAMSDLTDLEVLLIGCGERTAFIAPSIRQRFREAGIVIDAMDTGAACRTFNVLMTEDRRAAVALIPVD